MAVTIGVTLHINSIFSFTSFLISFLKIVFSLLPGLKLELNSLNKVKRSERNRFFIKKAFGREYRNMKIFQAKNKPYACFKFDSEIL
jgi:hypothetical protein